MSGTAVIEAPATGATGATGPTGAVGSPGIAGTAGTPTETPSIFSDGYRFAEGWADKFEGLNAASLAKFNGKEVADLARSYGELEKKIGQKTEGMVKMPTASSTPEELAAFHRSLGVPESPDAYEITPPDFAEELGWNPESLGPIKETAQKHGVTGAALNALIATQAEIEKAQYEEAVAEQEAAVTALRNEWGANFDRNVTLAKRAADAAGIAADNPKLNDPEILRAFANLGGKISEGQLGAVNAVSGGMSAADEARDIQTNPENPLYKAYRGEIPDRRKIEEARAKVTELNIRANRA